MKKSWTKIQLCALAAAALVAAGASAAPIVVTKGSNSGYLYFPGSNGGAGNTPTSGGTTMTINAMELATAVCMYNPGMVAVPPGFAGGG